MSVDDFLKTAHGLPEVTENESFGGMTAFKVRGKGFGYLNDAAETAMLKATRAEQAALIAEAPDVFSPSWASGRFAWLFIDLTKVDPGELTELITEAWRLSAPKRLAQSIDPAVGLAIDPAVGPGVDSGMSPAVDSGVGPGVDSAR